jgi:hypothetical protein
VLFFQSSSHPRNQGNQTTDGKLRERPLGFLPFSQPPSLFVFGAINWAACGLHSLIPHGRYRILKLACLLPFSPHHCWICSFVLASRRLFPFKQSSQAGGPTSHSLSLQSTCLKARKLRSNQRPTIFPLILRVSPKQMKQPLPLRKSTVFPLKMSCSMINASSGGASSSP